MKANRKFLRGDDAVSPVIAVILMVAITVVLAATVYVWVSGFGSQSSTPAKSLSLTTNGSEECALVDDATTPLDATDDDMHCSKEYVVASATQGMKYGDMTITVEGVEYTLDTADADADSEWSISRGGADLDGEDAIQAGDILVLYSVDADSGGAAGTEADATQVGDQVRILDSAANSIILTLTVT